MYLLIDNYDSFVHNLAAYFLELGSGLVIRRNDSLTREIVEEWAQGGQLEGIILSPGPKDPQESGKSGEIVQEMAGRVPMLGVCLGHQIIGYEFGASVRKGERPMHGKVTGISHRGRGLFQGLPREYQVTRYHSLVVDRDSLPECMEIDALSTEGEIMAIHHSEYPIYGVQFHPEAVLTEHGHALLRNFLDISKRWRESHGYHS